MYTGVKVEVLAWCEASLVPPAQNGALGSKCSPAGAISGSLFNSLQLFFHSFKIVFEHLLHVTSYCPHFCLPFTGVQVITVFACWLVHRQSRCPASFRWHIATVSRSSLILLLANIGYLAILLAFH